MENVRNGNITSIHPFFAPNVPSSAQFWFGSRQRFTRKCPWQSQVRIVFKLLARNFRMDLGNEAKYLCVAGKTLRVSPMVSTTDGSTIVSFMMHSKSLDCLGIWFGLFYSINFFSFRSSKIISPVTLSLSRAKLESIQRSSSTSSLGVRVPE